MARYNVFQLEEMMHCEQQILLLIIILLSFNLTSYNIIDNDIDIDLIRIKNDFRYKDIAIQEKEYLKLLDEYTSDEDQGKIFLRLISTYSTFNKDNIEKNRYYCEIASKLQLDILTKIRVNMYWAKSYGCPRHSYGIPYYTADTNECIENRRVALSKTIYCYNLLKDLNLPLEEQRIPPVSTYTWDLSKEDTKNESVIRMMNEQKLKCKKEIEVRERIIYENDLIRYKKNLSNLVLKLYSEKPYDIDKLQSTLKDNIADEELVQRVIDQLKTKISEQEERYKMIEEGFKLNNNHGNS